MSEVETIEVEKTVKETWSVEWVPARGCQAGFCKVWAKFHNCKLYHERDIETASWCSNPEMAPVVEAARRCILRNREPGEHETFTGEGVLRRVVPMRVDDGRLEVKCTGLRWSAYSRESLVIGHCKDSARRLAYLDKHTELRVEFRSDAAGERVVALRGDTVIHVIGGPCQPLPDPPDDLRRKMQRLWCERKTLGDLEFVQDFTRGYDHPFLSLVRANGDQFECMTREGDWESFNPERMAKNFPHPRGWTRALEIVQRLKREAEAEAKWEEIRPLKDYETRPSGMDTMRSPGAIGTMSITGSNELLITWSDGGSICFGSKSKLLKMHPPERLAFYEKNKLADDEGFLLNGTRVKFKMGASGKSVSAWGDTFTNYATWTPTQMRASWQGDGLTPELYDRCKAFWEAGQKKGDEYHEIVNESGLAMDTVYNGKGMVRFEKLFEPVRVTISEIHKPPSVTDWMLTMRKLEEVEFSIPKRFLGKNIRVRVECLEDES